MEVECEEKPSLVAMAQEALCLEAGGYCWEGSAELPVAAVLALRQEALKVNWDCDLVGRDVTAT